MASHAVTVELFYNGVWNIVPAYVRDGTRITHGRGNETSEPVPSSGTLTLDSRVTSYNPGNPLSPLYGVAGRNTPTRITVDGAVRLYGEGAGWKPQRSENFALGTPIRGDRWTEIEAAGTLRRLGQGATPLRSALYRALVTLEPLGYWSFEDHDGGVTFVPSDVGGGALQVVHGDARTTWSGGALLSGSGVLPSTTLGQVVGAANYRAAALPSAVGNDAWSLLVWAYTALKDDAETTNTLTIEIPVVNSPQIANWFMTFRFDNFGVAERTVVNAFATDHSGTFISDVSLTAAEVEAYTDSWRMLRVTVGLSGGLHRLRVYLDEVLLAAVSSAGFTVGQPSQVRAITAQVTNSAVPFEYGHFAVDSGSGTDLLAANAAAIFSAGFGYPGELAAARLARLATEQGETITVAPGDTEPMGPQRVDTFLDLLREIERTDDGILHEPRTAAGLAYRPRTSLYNQTPVLTLNFVVPNQVAYPLAPAVDDLSVRNDVTVQRRNGSSARAVLESGRLSVQPPPAGVGRVDTRVDVNTATDHVLSDHAFWHLAKGTVDATRYARVTVDLDANPGLAVAMANVCIGDLIEIRNTEEGGALLLVLGYTETIGSHRRKIIFNCVPAQPWTVAQVDGAQRVTVEGSALGVGGLTLAGTSFSLTSPVGVGPWPTDSGEFPQDIIVGGERITLSGISGAASPQTATVSARAVNGIAKAHTVGAPVDVWTPAVVGL